MDYFKFLGLYAGEMFCINETSSTERTTQSRSCGNTLNLANQIGPNKLNAVLFRT